MKLNDLNITPIQKLNNTINNNTIYIKRDDLIPFSFGGNKVRKALYFFKELEEIGADCVVTYGSSSSNHCRIVANMAALRDIPCHIISPIESSNPTTNSFMFESMGGHVTKCKVDEVADTIDNKILSLKKRGYNPYFIQGGGHGNLGTHSYVQAYNEIKRYENKSNISFDYIFHTTGTGTTQAGLICGREINKDNKKRIIGISNARKNPYGAKVVLESVNHYLSSIHLKHLTLEDVEFVDDYVLDGYGSFNVEIVKVIERILNKEGIPLDSTYTGKAFWGMEKYILNNELSGKSILFIHTGGTPLFFDNMEELLNG